MNPALLVLFSRALDLDMRGFATYAARMILVFVIIFALVSAQARSVDAGAPGLDFFKWVGITTLIFITLAGILLFATAISEEKEEMTLGLLKMTGLDPISIMLGKGASRVLAAMLLLLAQFPFTLLAITLGGVSLHQVVAAYVTLTAYLLFMGGLGIFASVVCKRSATAIAVTGALLVVFHGGPWMGKGILHGLVSSGYVAEDGSTAGVLSSLFMGAIKASPFWRFGEITVTGFDGAAFGYQATVNVVAAALFFLVAWLFFERLTAMDRDSAPGRSAWLLRTRFYRLLGVGRVWGHALVWKEFHFGIGGKMSMLVRFLGLVGLLVFIGWLSGGYDRHFLRDMGRAAIMVSFFIACLDLLGQSARSFNSEWRQKTLPALMVLPNSTGRLIREKVLGCLLILVPYAVIFLIGACMVPGRDIEGLFGDVIFTWEFVSTILVGLVFLYLNVYTSLRFKWIGVLVAAGILFGCVPVLGVFAEFSFGESSGVVIFIIGLMITLLFTLHVGIVRLIERRGGE